jgi:hypothetical protein
MASKVIIKNKTKKPPRMLVFNLDSGIYPKKITNKISVHGKDGKIRKKVVNKLCSESLRIPSRGQSALLDRKILDCKSIKNAIKKHEIIIIEINE